MAEFRREMGKYLWGDGWPGAVVKGKEALQDCLVTLPQKCLLSINSKNQQYMYLLH